MTDEQMKQAKEIVEQGKLINQMCKNGDFGSISNDPLFRALINYIQNGFLEIIEEENDLRSKGEGGNLLSKHDFFKHF